MTLQPGSSRRRTIWFRRLVAIGALLGVAVLAWLLLKDGGVLGPVDKRGAQVAHLWLDAGEEDPFRPGDEAFVSALDAAGALPTARTT